MTKEMIPTESRDSIRRVTRRQSWMNFDLKFGRFRGVSEITPRDSRTRSATTRKQISLGDVTSRLGDEIGQACSQRNMIIETTVMVPGQRTKISTVFGRTALLGQWLGHRATDSFDILRREAEFTSRCSVSSARSQGPRWLLLFSNRTELRCRNANYAQ